MRVLTYSTTITLTQHTYMLGSGTAGAFLFLPTPPHLWHRARNSGIVPSFLAPAPYLWPRALYVYLLSVSVSRKWATTLRQKRTKTSILCSKRPKTRVPEGKSAQKPQFCARNARKQGFQRPKKHKNPNFVLETPKNRGSEGQKSTKMEFLCSGGGELAPGREEIGIGKHNRRDAYRKRGIPANHRARFKNISS